MKSKFYVSKMIITTVVMAFVIALLPNCQKDDNFDKATLNEFLKSLQPISEVMPAEKAATVVSTAADTASEYIYHTTHYEAAAGYNDQIVLNPQTDVIYPGALVKGESILDGTYTLIPANRKQIGRASWRERV